MLIAINSKFIHSSLAVRSLSANCNAGISVLEFTINQDENYILSQIYKYKPDIAAFSCYIWNIEIVKRVINSLKKVLPETVIVLGGPEVTYNPVYFPDCDIIIRGEGEYTFNKLINLAGCGRLDQLEEIDGLSYMREGEIQHNKDSILLNLNTLKFPYNEVDSFKNKIIYYESSRGCPYSCAYCLQSAQAHNVRFLSLDRVYLELGFFLENRVSQVKFVDRTFNCDMERAEKIWRYLIEADNGITNFHFEIAADLFSNNTLILLKKARKGLFQFEAGVQSTNPRTLETVARRMDTVKLCENARTIKSFGNIHIHLDLIAGMPYETYESFKKSFNEVYSAKPDMLQLGFLKLLHGSALRKVAEKYGIKYRENAPYEVLSTNDISCESLFKLKNIEKTVEFFYNTGRYKASIKYFESFFESAFDLYEAIAMFWEQKAFFDISHNKIKMYENLYSFSCEKGINKDISAEMLLYDMLQAGDIYELPKWCARETNKDLKRGFYHNKEKLSLYVKESDNRQLNQIIKNTCLMRFCYDIMPWLNGSELTKKENYILFNYINKHSSPKVVEI